VSVISSFPLHEGLIFFTASKTVEDVDADEGPVAYGLLGLHESVDGSVFVEDDDVSTGVDRVREFRSRVLKRSL